MSSNDVSNDLLLVVTTEGDLKKAKKLGKAILQRKLAACINFSHVNSIYWWKNELEENAEVKLVIKTSIDMENKILDFIGSSHSYSLPELICIKGSSNKKYIEWIEDCIN